MYDTQRLRRGEFEASVTSWTRGEVRAYWHFYPQGRRYVSGAASLDMDEVLQLQSTVRYLWSVHWERAPISAPACLHRAALLLDEKGAPRALCPFPESMHGIQLQLRSDRDVEEFCDLLEDVVLHGWEIEERGGRTVRRSESTLLAELADLDSMAGTASSEWRPYVGWTSSTS